MPIFNNSPQYFNVFGDVFENLNPPVSVNIAVYKQIAQSLEIFQFNLSAMSYIISPVAEAFESIIFIFA